MDINKFFYFIFPLALLILGNLFNIIVVLHSKSKIKKSVEQSELSNEILSIAIKYNSLTSENKYADLVHLKRYMNQSDYIVNNSIFDLEKLKFQRNPVTSKEKIEQKKYLDKLFEELKKAPDDVSELFFELNEILRKVYKYKHPFWYRFFEFKKNTELQILKILIKLLKFLLFMVKISKTITDFGMGTKLQLEKYEQEETEYIVAINKDKMKKMAKAS